MCSDCVDLAAFPHLGYWTFWGVLVGTIVACSAMVNHPGEARSHRRARDCRGCEYSLDGLAEMARCPECGLDDARRRDESLPGRVELEFRTEPLPSFFVLAVMIIGAAAARLAGLNHVVHERYFASGALPFLDWADFTGLDRMDWGATVIIFAGIAAKVITRTGGFVLRRSLMVGSVVIVAAWLHAVWRTDPPLPGGGDHAVSVIIAYGVLWIAVGADAALGVWRRRSRSLAGEVASKGGPTEEAAAALP